MLRYNNFILENKIIELLLESQITFKPDFQEILTAISKKGDKIADELLKLNGTDLSMNQNVISLSDNKNAIQFTSSDKKQIKKIIVNNGQTYSSWKELYEELGFENPEGEHILPNGTIGTVKSEFPHPMRPEIIIAYFISDAPINGQKGECVIGLPGISDVEIPQKPSNMNIGRFITKMLTTAKIEFTPKQIEDFVNKFKSEFDAIKNNVYRHFKVVNGDDIKKYYSQKVYEEPTKGSLWGSCMRYDECQNFFKIYTENPDKIQLLILLSQKNPEKIKGRALIWKLDTPVDKEGNGRTFLDRIYVRDDADVHLFINYAKEKGWLYKTSQSNDIHAISEGAALLSSKLSKTTFDNYPYLDTMAVLADGCMYNYAYNKSKYYYVLRSASGTSSRNHNY